MIEISIRTNFPDIARRIDALPEKIANQAIARALNDTVQQGKTEMARGISQEFRLTVSEVRERLQVQRASAKGSTLRLSAILRAKNGMKGRSMNLIRFSTGALTRRAANKVAKAAGQGRAGADLAGQLGFQIKRQGGRKVIPGAFIGNHGRTVFIRTGKGRLPIKALSTIDVPQMFNARRINEAVRAAMLKRFRTNFDRELRTVLGGWAR